MKKLNTIDLDLNARFPNDNKEKLDKVIYTIIRCKDSICVYEVKDSSSKGYHITFYCKKDCENCRLIFDDDKRFASDCQRAEQRKNVLFDAKGVKMKNEIDIYCVME